LKIYFDGEVYYESDEQLKLPIKHQFKNQLNIDDPFTLIKIAQFNATIYNGYGIYAGSFKHEFEYSIAKYQTVTYKE